MVVVRSSWGWKVEVRRWDVTQGFEVEGTHGDTRLVKEGDEYSDVAVVLMESAEEERSSENIDSAEEEKVESPSDERREGISVACA